MKIEEACRLLNADMDESEKAVKNKYRKAIDHLLGEYRRFLEDRS